MDESPSQIRNPKSQIGLCEMPQSNLIFRNFGFKMQESSDFKIFTHIGTRVVKDVVPPSRKGMPEGKTMATDPGICWPRTISDGGLLLLRNLSFLLVVFPVFVHFTLSLFFGAAILLLKNADDSVHNEAP